MLWHGVNGGEVWNSKQTETVPRLLVRVSVPEAHSADGAGDHSLCVCKRACCTMTKAEPDVCLLACSRSGRR